MNFLRLVWSLVAMMLIVGVSVGALGLAYQASPFEFQQPDLASISRMAVALGQGYILLGEELANSTAVLFVLTWIGAAITWMLSLAGSTCNAQAFIRRMAPGRSDEF